MVNRPSDEPANTPEKIRIQPKKKPSPLFMHFPKEQVPDILRTDESVLEMLRNQVVAILDGKDSLNFTQYQIKFLIAYVKFCIQNRLSFSSTKIAGAALYYLSQDVELDVSTRDALQTSEPIVAIAQKLRGKIATVKIIDDPIEPTESDTPKSMEALNYLKEAQHALSMHNYDEAIALAEHVARLPNPKVEAVLSAGICYAMRATQKPATATSKIEDLGFALDHLEEYMVRTKDDQRAITQRASIQKKIRDLSVMRNGLMRRENKKK
jgi:hypothetical protein